MTQANGPLHPSIPRVQCPRCGKPMRLASVDPDLTSDRPDQMTFDCECGFVYQQSERARSETRLE
jgi:RNase P subunit RPR2